MRRALIEKNPSSPEPSTSPPAASELTGQHGSEFEFHGFAAETTKGLCCLYNFTIRRHLSSSILFFMRNVNETIQSFCKVYEQVRNFFS
jgi:hypothetical protein